jgi:hypothetical protein
LVVFTYAFFFSGGGPNQATRMALTESLVVRHQPDITPYHARTIDKGFRKERFFADKAPGVSLLATLPYEVMRIGDRIGGIPSESRAAQQAKLGMLTFLLAGLPGLACALLLLRLALLLGCRRPAAELAAFAYAFGTIAFPFSTLLFGHQLSTLCILSAFVITVERRKAGTLKEPRVLAALGAIWTLSLVVEYPTALLVAVFGTATLVWTFDRGRPVRSVVRTLLWAGAGGLPLLVIHAAFLVWSYGKFALPYIYVSEPYFRAHMSGGILGIGVPTLLATYGSLLSPYRGLVFYCPVVALAVAGLGSWIDSAKDRAVMPVVLAALGIYLLFGCSYYAWDGGGSVGPRHLLPIIPLLLLLVAFFADRSRWTFGVTLALAIASGAIMLAVTTVHVQLPLGDTYHANPFYDVVVRSILDGKGAINSQDAYVPYPRADGAFNLGMILGFGPLSALVIVPAAWAAAYLLPSLAPRFRKPAHA